MDVKLVVNLLILLLLSQFNAVFADDVIIEKPQGGINWTQGKIFAKGFGIGPADRAANQRRLMAERAAIVDAQRKLLEITKGVRINSTFKTAQLMNANRETETRVNGIVRGAQVVKRHYQNDVASVTLAMPIAGSFLKTILSRDLLLTQKFSLDREPGYQPDPNGLPMQIGNFVLNTLISSASASDQLIITSEPEKFAYQKLLKWMQHGGTVKVDAMLNRAIIQYESNNQFSGLLIDASKVIGFELATIPRIRDQSGKILYPTAQTSYDHIVDKRGVTYDFDLNDAIRNRRVATTPFIIEALSTYKNLSSDLVIATEDAERILKSKSTIKAMNKAGVLIVVSI